MARKKKSSKPPAPSGDARRFSVGDAVRVRAGVIDPDFPDIPLSGWAGVVDSSDGQNPPRYLVRWTSETLAQITPAYRVRRDRLGLHPTESELLGSDLVPDTGGPLEIIAATTLRPPPLDRDDPQDRVRAILRLTSDDPLPPVDETSLRRFHEHFRKKLKVPSQAMCNAGEMSQRLVTVLRLVPFAESNVEHGLVVEVEQGDQIGTGPLYDISLLSRNAIADDVEAYSEWFFELQDAH